MKSIRECYTLAESIAWGPPMGMAGQFVGLAAIAKDEFKSEIDMTRPFPRQDQFCSGAPDRIAIHADGGETWRDQTAHFEIAEADDARPVAPRPGRNATSPPFADRT